ncbi:MAG: hypothetical protein L0346_27615, partial [Chloroflexi bacterium]|nr:hypothetical protein [Chloroflexota bacterium]
LELEEARDNVRRVFIVSPEQVAAANPAYGEFLAQKVRQLGRDHPIVASEYYNEPVGGAGSLFDARRLALLRGTHPRQRAPQPGRTYLATLDVAGQDEAATDPLAALANPGRDYTVATIFELLPAAAGDPGPTYLAVDVFVDQGSRHFQDAPGRPRLVDRLLAWLRHWNAAHLVADESGVGAGLVSWLAAQFGTGRVTGFHFAAGHGKAWLGSAFLAVVETGRCRYWSDDPARPGSDQPLSDGWWFFTQAAACAYTLPPEGRFERDLRWGVPAAAQIDTPAGRLPIHDDRLLSAALVAVYDDLFREGRLPTGQGRSAVIRPRDPLEDLEF